MKIPKINLLFKIIIAIILGILCAWWFPVWLDRIFMTFNAIFSQFLGFIIPLIILGFVTPAIAEIGSNSGKILFFTVLLAYASTSFAGFLSFGVGDAIFPNIVERNTFSDNLNQPQLPEFFTVEMPPVMGIMSALVLSFVAGLSLSMLSAPTLLASCKEFRNIVSLTINKVVIPLLPIYIFGIFLKMSYTGEVATILVSFAKIILIIFALHIFLLLFQYCIAGLVAKKNPIKLLLTMMPAYFTALGTQSSAATIPVTLRQTIKMGVREETAGFVIPLCATIHMSGSAMKIVACAIAIMIMQGIPYDAGMFAEFICMIGISIIAAPGVPGGAIMASLGLLASILGFSQEDQALMIALYIAMDSFGTACNVTGDGFIAIIINRCFPASALSRKATTDII